jgi:hypothetical protein
MACERVSDLLFLGKLGGWQPIIIGHEHLIFHIPLKSRFSGRVTIQLLPECARLSMRLYNNALPPQACVHNERDTSVEADLNVIYTTIHREYINMHAGRKPSVDDSTRYFYSNDVHDAVMFAATFVSNRTSRHLHQMIQTAAFTYTITFSQPTRVICATFKRDHLEFKSQSEKYRMDVFSQPMRDSDVCNFAWVLLALLRIPPRDVLFDMLPYTT